MTSQSETPGWAWLPSAQPARSQSAARSECKEQDVRVGMPHLNAGGLSESWLFRHAGDQYWQALGARAGGSTDTLRSDAGLRLYPTFLAVRARYRAPLAHVRENDKLGSQVALTWGARGYCHGFVTLTSERTRCRLEMLTMLAARSPSSGDLRAAMPRAGNGKAVLCFGAAPAPPTLVTIAKAARNGQRHDDPFSGEAFARPLSTLASVGYQPSPYSDFNGAGLLYFASYVSIADTAERHIAHQLGWASRGDWALATSTIQRDVFYYGNIRIGEAVSTHLLAVEWGPLATVKTHLRMVRQADGSPLADLITVKKVGVHLTTPAPAR